MATYREFSEADWARIAQDWGAWWRGELDRPLVVIEQTPVGSLDGGKTEQLTGYGLDVPVSVMLDDVQRQLDVAQFYADAFPKWWVNFGAGMLAGFLGSPVHYQTETTWFGRLPVESLSEITIAVDEANPWWRRVNAVTDEALARWGDRVAIGMTDIGGGLDVLASLRGTDRLLMDVLDAPDEVERLAGEITRVWLDVFDVMCRKLAPAGRGICNWSPCWAPDRGYMLQCDFSYMISPRLFRRFVLPDLIACCEAMEYGFYHLDGKGALVHLDLLLGIERLRGIQWQPGAGNPLADQWPDVLRRIRAGGKLCQVYVTRAGALTIAREIGGKGFLFYLVDEPELSEAEIDAFLDELFGLGAGG